MKLKVPVYMKAVLVKSFEIDDSLDKHDAMAEAFSRAQKDIDYGNLRGWEMTAESEVREVDLESAK